MLGCRLILLKSCRCYLCSEIASSMISQNSQSATTINSRIAHDPSNLTFELSIPGCDEKGYISYVHLNESTVDLQHTFVPESMRGQGIAKKLAKHAFEFVNEHNLKMKLSCWYLQKYLKENPKPEYTLRVVDTET